MLSYVYVLARSDQGNAFLVLQEHNRSKVYVQWNCKGTPRGVHVIIKALIRVLMLDHKTMHKSNIIITLGYDRACMQKGPKDYKQGGEHGKEYYIQYC